MIRVRLIGRISELSEAISARPGVFKQLSEIEDMNREVAGKAAYLHLAVANKSITPMWDESEVRINLHPNLNTLAKVLT